MATSHAQRTQVAPSGFVEQAELAVARYRRRLNEIFSPPITKPEIVLNVTRAISSDIRYASRFGRFEDALRNLSEILKETTTTAHVMVKGDEEAAPWECREDLFIIIHEALRNSLSHAYVANVDVLAK